MTHQTEIVRNVLDENREEGIKLDTKVTLWPELPQKIQNDELERQKAQLRNKYINLATQVRNFPQFRDREYKDIDVGITLLSLKSGETLEESKMLLTQSDTVKQWHQEFSRDELLNATKQYIQQITSKAIELLQKHNLKEKSL